MTTHPYPVHVNADLEPGLNRWPWLVGWVLALGLVALAAPVVLLEALRTWATGTGRPTEVPR